VQGQDFCACPYDTGCVAQIAYAQLERFSLVYATEITQGHKGIKKYLFFVAFVPLCEIAFL
jgi:hypothetical protein